jgi:hypothetical protein
VLIANRKLRFPESQGALRPNHGRSNSSSEVARLVGKKPLTRLATLATLSPRERAVNDDCFQPSPVGRGWPAAGAFTSRNGPGEGSFPYNLNTRSLLRPIKGWQFEFNVLVCEREGRLRNSG